MCLGIPGKVLEIRSENDLPMGKVEFGGIVKEICLAYTPEVQIGDYVIVHVGFAISRVDEEEAKNDFFLSRTNRPGGGRGGVAKCVTIAVFWIAKVGCHCWLVQQCRTSRRSTLLDKPAVAPFAANHPAL